MAGGINGVAQSPLFAYFGKQARTHAIAQHPHRAAGLTHRLLAFSRRQSLDPRPIDANQLVAGMEELLRRSLGEQHELRLRFDQALWTAEADANQLESALLNLALNARDAMSGGGVLTVSTENATIGAGAATPDGGIAPGEYVLISVAVIFFGIAMLHQPRFGRVLGGLGILAGVLLLTFNIWYFPTPPANANSIDWGPLVALWMVWTGRPFGPELYLLTMAGSLVFGLVNHFVIESPDHVSHITSATWRLPFQLSAAALAVLEAAGTLLGIRLLAAKRTSTLRALP